MLRTDDRVDFPVANSALLLDYRRPLTDVNPAWDDAATSTVPTAPIALLTPAAKMAEQCPAGGPVRPHMKLATAGAVF